VRDAFATFGKRGLILSAVPSIRAHWPWENALAMFDEWRRLRKFEETATVHATWIAT
jgi:hypothetical protein